MQVEVITHSNELNDLATAWNQLPLPSPMQAPAWLTTWWETYGGGNRQLCTLGFYHDQQLVGLAPLYIDTTDKTLRWLGDGRVCSDHQTLLVEQQHADAVTTAMVNWLIESDSTVWRQLRLEAVNDDDSTLQLLLEKLTAADCPVNEREEPGSCYINLPEDWESFLRNVSKNHRKRLRRYYKEYFDTGRATVETLSEANECLNAFDTLVRLHNDRRTTLGEAGAFEDPQFLHFHRTVVERIAELEQVRLSILSVDGQPMAAEYVLHAGESVFAYQGGLSAAGEQVSAGGLSMLWQVKQAIEAGHTQFDLLRGVEPYKFSWDAKHRPATTYVVRQPTRTARFAAFCETAYSGAKRVRRSLAGAN